MTSQELLDSLGKAFGSKIEHQTEFRGETTCMIGANDLREITKYCRDELSFDYLIDITSIDNFGEEPRFEHDGNQIQRTPGPSSHSNVGWLSVLPTAKRFSARRIAQRDARCRFHQSHTSGRRPVRYCAEHRDFKRPRTTRTTARIVSSMLRARRRTLPHQAAETGGADSGFRVATITSGRRPSSRGMMVVVFEPSFG